LEARNIEIKETVPASRKLQAGDSKDLLSSASKLIAIKGKKIKEFKGGKDATDDAIASMLGPTGNMRAPTIKTGKTLIIGFNEEVFARQFGA
jgi:arsenate reductase-like glutaredoxin family protein